MTKFKVSPVEIVRFAEDKFSFINDLIAQEEPCEIQLTSNQNGNVETRSISITMCSPNQLKELSIGFLFTESILKNSDQIRSIDFSVRPEIDGIGGNIVKVVLRDDISVDLGNIQRNFYTTSSCGVCGKSSIDAVKIACPIYVEAPELKISSKLICQLTEKASNTQESFNMTGGNHSCTLFDSDGNILKSAEDVGRHNALDKLIGSQFLENNLPLNNCILLLSGRASFELVQKASMAGIRIICAIGAPSSLAVELAEELEITLIGFLKSNRFNIYSTSKRITL